MFDIKTRLSTFIYMTINIGINLLIIIMSLIFLGSDLTNKGLLIVYIIINIAEIIYIIYRFFKILVINCAFLIIKYVFFAFNFANIAVIMYYAYRDQGTNKKLSNKQLRVYSLFICLFIFKFYIQLFSRCRYQTYLNELQNKCEVEIEYEKGGEAFGPSDKKNELNDLKKENAKLRKENQNLKGYTTNLVIDFLKEKKAEIICQSIKSDYNINITPEQIFQRMFLEMRNSGLFIDKQKYEEIISYYIKERLLNILKCPLTGKILNNPVITPDGRTFEKDAILEKIKKDGKNPLTENELKEKQLIQNILVLKILQILNDNEFNLQDLNEIKKLLTSQKTNKFYEKPFVISSGKDKGNTGENALFLAVDKYLNIIIIELIEENLDILDDSFKVFDIDLGNNYNSTRNVNTNNNYDTNMVNSEDIHMIKK